MKKFLILLMLLISFNLVLGLEASNVQFFRGQQEVDYVSFNRLPVDMHFDVIGDNILSIFTDLSVLNRQYSPNTYIDLGRCESTDSGYSCVRDDLILSLTDETVEISFRLMNTSGEEFETIIPYTFTIDNTRPSVSWMGTERCLDDICFVAANKMTDIVINLDDGLGNFQKKMVFFDIGSNRHWVDNCTGTNCHGLARVDCQSGDNVKLMISSYCPPGRGCVQSQDDAGNPVEGGMTTAWLTCDADAPALVDDVVVVSNSDYGQIQEGDTLTITVNVSENLGKVTGSVNLSNLNGDGIVTVECTEWQDVHTCEWSVPNIVAGTVELEFSFEDTAGNVLEDVTEEIVVLPTIEGRTPDCFTVSTEDIVQGQIDRIMLQLALDTGIPFSSYGGFTLNKKTCNQPTILNQEIISCVYKVGDNISTRLPFKNKEIVDKSLEYGNPNKIEFVYEKLDVNDLGEAFSIICNLSIAVADSAGVYDVEETETVEYGFSMRNSRLGEPGEAFIEKIEEWENKPLVQSKAIDVVDQLFATLNDLCAVGVALDYVESAAVATEVVGKAIQVVTGNTGVLIAGGKMFLGANRAEEIMKAGVSRDEVTGALSSENWALGILGESCALTSCSLPQAMEESGDKWYDNDWAQAFQLDDYFTNLDALDPSESIYAAISTKCYKALLSHLKGYRDNNCEVLACLKESSLHGIDVYGCEQINDAYICSKVVGEVAEWWGPVRIAQNFVDNAATYVKYLVPNVLLGVTKKVGCKWGQSKSADGMKSAWEIGFCDIPDSIGRFMLQSSLSEETRTYHYAPTENVCKYAMCSLEEIDSGNCPKPSTSWLSQFGALPRPTDDDLRGFRKSIRDASRGKLDPRVVENALTKYYADRLWQQKAEQDGNDYNNERERYELSPEERDILEDYFYGEDLKDVSLDDLDEALNPDTVNQRTAQMNGERQETDAGVDLENLDDQEMLGETRENLYEIEELKGVDKTRTQIQENDAAIEDKQEELAGLEDNEANQERRDSLTQEIDTLTTQNTELQNKVDDEGFDNNFEENKNDLETEDPLINEEDLSEDGITDYNNDKRTLQQQRDAEIHNIKAKKTTSIISRVLFSLVIREHGTLSALLRQWNAPDSWIGFADWVESVDSDSIKNSVCYATNNFGRSDTNHPGVVQECEGTDCSVVLTFGAERMQYNETSYLYSFVYLISGISEDVDYKVYLEKEDGGKVYTIKSWKTLFVGETHTLETADLSNSKFVSMCLEFKKPFPPGSLADTDLIPGVAKKEYCRDIKEDTFFTGEPVSYSSEEGYHVNEESGWEDV